MTPSTALLKTPRLSNALAAAAVMVFAGALLPVTASAQQVFRIVGPDGKVTFSDQPPPPGSNTRASAANTGSSSGTSAAALPFELRQVVSKFPVTLYTANACGACDAGRAMLTNRGIPFTERTIGTPEDTQALQRLAGDASLPFLTIGGQQIKGYADVEWTQFLDAAGYPKSSILPAGYRRAAATPLVTVSAPPAAAPAAAPAETPATVARPAQRPAPAPNENPAGIQF